jgi:hypothetical protein
VRAARKPAGPKAPPPTGGEELKEARRIVEDYVAKVLALRRRLDGDLIKVNAASMTPRFEKQNRDDLARWARKEAAEKVLRTEKVSPEEFRVETSGEGLGRLRYTIRAAEGKLRIDLVQRQCEFCLGKGQCPHCEGKGCKDCSKTGLCFVCEGRIWEEYSRCP